MIEFDDARLEDAEVLRDADPLLRPLAEAGSRVRREYAAAQAALAELESSRPRAVIAVGPEARLLRALLEPICPVPFVAWPALGLPGWVGPLDVVVVLGGSGRVNNAGLFEAVRRGSRVLLSAPPDSPLARQFASRATTLLPAPSGDPLAAAAVALAGLHTLGLGPAVDVDNVADALDAVAVESSYAADVTVNPAKQLALELADATPLIWGGSVLAKRAARRVAEAFRAASGRVGLAADDDSLLPLLRTAPRRDPFADPFEADEVTRPGLLLLDDGNDDESSDADRDRLIETARLSDIRVSRISQLSGSPLERYVTLLQRGRFAAAYLQIGLGRS